MHSSPPPQKVVFQKCHVVQPKTGSNLQFHFAIFKLLTFKEQLAALVFA
jgi:hypothetical protein